MSCKYKAKGNNKAYYYYRRNIKSSCYSAYYDEKLYISLIKHIKNSIKYLNQNKINIPDSTLYFIISNIINVFLEYKGKNKELLYYKCRSFIVKDMSLFNTKIIEFIKNKYNKLYEQYLLIKNNNTYEKYLHEYNILKYITNINSKVNYISKKIEYIENKIYDEEKRVKLFSIYNYEDKIVIKILILTISFKKKLKDNSFFKKLNNN